MTVTLIGQVATSKGFVEHEDRAGDTHYSRTPAVNYLRSQPATIPVHFTHDTSWTLGTVAYLERSRADGLLAIANIDSDIGELLDDGPWYFSDRINFRAHQLENSDVTMRELSLTREPASSGTRPVRWSPGAIGSAGAPLNLPLTWYDTWTRAAEAMYGSRYRRTPDALLIADVDDLSIPEMIATDPVVGRAMLAAATSAARSKATPKHRSESFGGRVYRHTYGGSLHLT